MAIAALTFAAACLILVGADLVGSDYAYAALLAAAIVVAVGECFYTTALMPLVAELAPVALRGRYMATIGTVVVDRPGARADARDAVAERVAAGGHCSPRPVWRSRPRVSALALERELPAVARLTPRPGERRLQA